MCLGINHDKQQRLDNASGWYGPNENDPPSAFSIWANVRIAKDLQLSNTSLNCQKLSRLQQAVDLLLLMQNEITDVSQH